ncbi:MAG: Hemerythrin-like protein metal-binding protein [Parcubacteria group bacterium GW2011_GWC1_42_11]|uniref:Hemerythrin-like protein metal-binding protein n=1 Tax=Candidatus Nomurabacteria bacterium GW2011_GWC2_42_20 TaxID=1618756 RepID=A0A0G0ZH92_9BACT|nr:MAG: Hemerythrin-like protein metal-binding protein [Parcubacteria group bacterium GW2011_GWC1_42_11]KKS48082.1 MAG: Hemerythrin-like protein metal-binding protein [Candidatus Nomurabacteria bacterium GW2011_GWC2_42_20]KKS59280.1 MAG: Hemerythrin-like protein metal-binding protein [Candidatus Nomurabacteria bacterium GW2011_GWA2_42_41]KKT09622.1 MAG: Hemerythrin-like protein metal-binding protein [Candidatus Nomurabacteria bacterium GW2011_GWB1_43_20]TAN36466.1 MAG: bacteriohemerythrin [Pate
MNDLIAWRESYNLGISEIDPQHQKLIGIINKLYNAMRASTEKEEMQTILKELTDYADYHFSTEEKHFEEFNYVDKVPHTKSHDAYKEKIAQFSKSYESNESNTLPFDLMDYLGSWWTGHILGEDRKYVECFHEHGLK